MLTIGIDFGTTNSSAAIFRHGRVELVPLEGESTILPSTICISRDQQILFGSEAIEHYLSLTGRRPIRSRFTDLRELVSVFQGELAEPLVESSNPWVIVAPAAADDDVDQPARLFQSLKIALRDPHFHGTEIYERYYAVEELIALVLGHIRKRVEAYAGEPVRAAVIGRPVSYAPRAPLPGVAAEEINATAHERMLAAARLAGFTHAALMYEPVAAARHFGALLAEGNHALVFDFGGGTLDLTLCQLVGDGSLEIKATHGIPLGGDDLDSAIMEHALLKHFGQGSTIGSKQLPFPPHLLDPLLRWQTIAILAKPIHAAHIAAIKRQSNSPQAVENLQNLVRQGLGFRLFRLIEAAKITLSERSDADIVLREGGLDIAERITRAAFVAAIANYLGEIEQAVQHLLEEARMGPEQVDAVLMTGGSSLVPVVQSLVGRMFPEGRVRVADPFSSIAAGLSIIAAEDDLCRPVTDVVSSATTARLEAEAVTIGERVAFQRGHQSVQGLVVRRAGGRLHDAILVIEFWDEEIQQFVSTMRHETKVIRLTDRPRDATEARLGG